MQPEKSRTIYSGARAEWDRALICIRNGVLLAAAAGLNSISPDLIGSGLKALEGRTRCGGIINWDTIKKITSVVTILNLIP